MTKIRNISKLLLIFSLAFILIFSNAVFAADPAQITVEGQSNYFVTGESYATDIAFSGYNSNNTTMYLNLALETTKIVAAGSTAEFKYYVEIYDGSGVKLGGIGSDAVPETVTTADASDTVQVTNEPAVLTSDLTAAFRTVVTVKSVTVTP